jgi:hypothetical protein
MRDAGGQHHAPAALLTGKDKVPIFLEARRTAGPIWTARKISPPRTFQPVANRYSEYVIPARCNSSGKINISQLGINFRTLPLSVGKKPQHVEGQIWLRLRTNGKREECMLVLPFSLCVTIAWHSLPVTATHSHSHHATHNITVSLQLTQ